MFTGLVEEVGQVKRLERTGGALRLAIRARRTLEGMQVGDSVAVNGVCLTVTSFAQDLFTVDVVPETVRRSNLAYARAGSRVNLERAMRADARFGGHLVAGHVDGVGTVRQVVREDNALVLSLQVDPTLLRYVVGKGSVALDGVSLTVMDVARDSFRVSIIPHTAAATTLISAKAGSKVNVEVDMIGKYAEKLVGRQNEGPNRQSEGLTRSKLREWGY